MHDLEEISVAKLREIMMYLAENAKVELFETFETEEEIKRSPSREYFALLDKKAKEGIWVLRLGFGNNKEFSELVDKYPGTIPEYQWILAKTTLCKKMMLVDNRHLLFSSIEDGKEHHFLTTDKKLIREYRDYFEAELHIVGVIK